MSTEWSQTWEHYGLMNQPTYSKMYVDREWNKTEEQCGEPKSAFTNLHYVDAIKVSPEEDILRTDSKCKRQRVNEQDNIKTLQFNSSLLFYAQSNTQAKKQLMGRKGLFGL